MMGHSPPGPRLGPPLLYRVAVFCEVRAPVGPHSVKFLCSPVPTRACLASPRRCCTLSPDPPVDLELLFPRPVQSIHLQLAHPPPPHKQISPRPSHPTSPLRLNRILSRCNHPHCSLHYISSDRDPRNPHLGRHPVPYRTDLHCLLETSTHTLPSAHAHAHAPPDIHALTVIQSHLHRRSLSFSCPRTLLCFNTYPLASSPSVCKPAANATPLPSPSPPLPVLPSPVPPIATSTFVAAARSPSPQASSPSPIRVFPAVHAKVSLFR
jgi:hypothetical protein